MMLKRINERRRVVISGDGDDGTQECQNISLIEDIRGINKWFSVMLMIIIYFSNLFR